MHFLYKNLIYAACNTNIFLLFQYTFCITQIAIPDSVTSIRRGAFLGCSRLSQIDIPPGVTSIGDSTFAACTSLTQINISSDSKLTSIGNDAFARCGNLT